MNTKSLKIFAESLGVGILFTVLSLVVADQMGWMSILKADPIEVFAAFTSYSCTYMCVMQSRWNYPMAVLSTTALAYVFWSSGLLASAALNLYLIPTVIYGYFIWGRDEDTRPVEHVKIKALYQYAFWTIVAYLGAWGLVTLLGGNFAPADSFLLVGSIFAQFLLDRKKIETWFIWIAVNIVSIYIYFESGLYLLAFQFVYFLANAVFGYYQWKKGINT